MKSRRTNRRRGAITVEFAIVAVPLFVFVFASIEFGRAMMAIQAMEEAARAGVREAVIQTADSASVEAAATAVLEQAGINEAEIEVDPANFTDVQRREPISVLVTVSLEDVLWSRVPQFVDGLSYTSSSTLPKEASPDE